MHAQVFLDNPHSGSGSSIVVNGGVACGVEMQYVGACSPLPTPSPRRGPKPWPPVGGPLCDRTPSPAAPGVTGGLLPAPPPPARSHKEGRGPMARRSLQRGASMWRCWARLLCRGSGGQAVLPSVHSAAGKGKPFLNQSFSICGILSSLLFGVFLFIIIIIIRVIYHES